MNINEIFEKYTSNVLKNIDKDNFKKILDFLEKENCNFLDEIIEDYLDIFMIDYDSFIKKYTYLNNKYNNKYLEYVSEDMNLLEELYYDI